MRRLILIRHAKSDYPFGVPDHNRPLAERGLRDAPQIGRHLRDEPWVTPTSSLSVVVSSALRAQQTWLAAAAELEASVGQVPYVTESRIYEASPSTLRTVVAEHADADTVVVVGHNPGLVQLVAELGCPSDTRSRALEKFPTSAVAVLSSPEGGADVLNAIGTFDVSSFVIPRG